MRAGSRALFLTTALSVVGGLGGCGSSSNAPTESSLYGSCTNVDAGTACDWPDGSAFDAVHAVLAKSCLPACHDGSPDAAWPLTSYDDVESWSNVVSDELVRCTMPPVSSGYPMSRRDRETILNWIACGAPP